ncbi:hypothetical protein KsCSTR_37500 [Candidatus Kuenenia stuttgartiensis]|uniref:Uncharacterized protein n=1 Tax=Kuenenia stuttgartiensis TaxID=174633 RepID=Q1Q673_KUEST|nr:hypothetical protein KsCSTR_37500 [Candidatus Kuenenia stuttgartiensis]CAJ73072.1 unknown protein [Candidatus Kuenenia stuttgartiensis]
MFISLRIMPSPTRLMARTNPVCPCHPENPANKCKPLALLGNIRPLLRKAICYKCFLSPIVFICHQFSPTSAYITMNTPV